MQLKSPNGRSSDQFVTIVMPALNEERYIRDAILSVLPDPNDIDCELLVMDGGSTDGTCALVQKMHETDPRIRLLHNPKKVQSAAVNLAARKADPRARCLVRAVGAVWRGF
ncbi:MAG: glycosyltransferase [Pseudomonadota bacterium]